MFIVTGIGFLTRMKLLSGFGIPTTSCYIYLLFWGTLFHRWFRPGNNSTWRFLLFLCSFSICSYWSIFRDRNFTLFPIQSGFLYKLCSQHFCTLCRKKNKTVLRTCVCVTQKFSGITRPLFYFRAVGANIRKYIRKFWVSVKDFKIKAKCRKITSG